MPAAAPMSAVVSPRPPACSVRRLAIEPTIVTSRPSRIQTVPSPTMISQCHLDHGSRSSRFGMFVSITLPVGSFFDLAFVLTLAVAELIALLLWSASFHDPTNGAAVQGP